MLPRHRDSLPIRFVDYVDLVPGAKRTPPTDEDRERMHKMADGIKEFAKKHDIKFLLAKGDDR
jgi:hypothetical protein